MSLKTVDVSPFRHIELEIGEHRISLAKVMEALRVLYPNERVVLTISDTHASIELFHDAPGGYLVSQSVEGKTP